MSAVSGMPKKRNWSAFEDAEKGRGGRREREPGSLSVAIMRERLIPFALVFDGLDLGRQRAGGQHLEFGAQLDALAEEVQQLVFLMEVAGFDVEDHLVDAAGVDDFDLPPLDVLEAGHDLFHLMGVDEHALDARGGVHAAHDAAEARAGAAAGAGRAVDVGEVARGEADERVRLVERGHDDFAHFAVLQRDARIGMADFHVAAVRDVQAGLVEAFVADAAHVRRAVALAEDDVELLFELVAHLFGQAFAGDEGHFLKEILAQVDALFLGLLGEVHQVARRADVAGHAQLLHDVELRAGIGRSRRDGGAAEVAQGLFKHQPGRGQVVVEGHLHHVAGTP